MKKVILISLFKVIILLVAITSNTYAKIYHLNCKYNDGSGNEKFKINTDTNVVVWSNDSREEIFRIIRNFSNNHQFRAFNELNVYTEDELNDENNKPFKDMMIYEIDLKSLDIELFDIINGYSNRAEIIYYVSLRQKFFVDEKNNERFFLPSQEQIDNSTRAKNDLIKNKILQDRSYGYAHTLKCVSY